MKKQFKLVLAAGVGILGVAFCGSAYAMHDGGVAHCDACHTMHNSDNSAAMAGHTTPSALVLGTVGTGVTAELTKGSDPSSTCLNCHMSTVGSYHVLSTDPQNTSTTKANAGGDFFWLTTDVKLSSRTTTLKANHGHSIVAADFGLTADGVNTTGPSDGTVAYPSSKLGCNSCHDPHGKKANNTNPGPIEKSGSSGVSAVTTAGDAVGNYRLLAGLGYDGGKQAAGDIPAFTAGAPTVVAPLGTDSQTNHADYGSGMSEWCVNCHSGFTGAGDTSVSHRHPAGASASMSAGIQVNYNSYVTTGNMTGSAATAFDHLIPFERGVAANADGTIDAAKLGSGSADTLSVSNTNGVDGNSRVMCLTCHRAHATPFANGTRWAAPSTFPIVDLTYAVANNPTITGLTTAVLMNGDDMSRYTAGVNQRSLCNKCHAQD